MLIEVDLNTIPPRRTLQEPNDFTSFKIVTTGDHAFVGVEEIKSLAGERAKDADWLERRPPSSVTVASRSTPSSQG